MTATYTSSLGLTLPGVGDTGWGTTVNNGVTSLVDSAIAGYVNVTMTDANYTLTSVNGAADEARKMLLNISGTLTAARNVTIPARSKLYFIRNNTTGGFAITVTIGSGTTVSIPNGRSMVVMCDGSNVREAVDYFNSLNTSAIGATTPGTGAFTTLSASSTVSGAGFSAYLASPPAIGGTAAAAGSFTSLAYSTTLTGGTGVVNFGSGQFYKDASGNVGIGTAAPNSLLHLKTASPVVLVETSGDLTTTATSYINFNGSNGDSGYLGFGAGGSTAAMGLFNRLSGPLVMATANTERMRIDSSGNVGINTTSPGSALDVKGTLRLSGSTSGYVGFIPAAAAGATTYTLPSADGTTGQVLQTNGSAVLSWATPATGISNFTSNLNTTAPNATVPYVQLLATNAATNVDVAITPKGTGAFSLQVADNATAGGNKRGTNAIDLQTLRSNASQVASGASAVAIGTYNTASGGGAIAIGGGSVASGFNSVAIGPLATASNSYSFAVGNNSISSGSSSVAFNGTASGDSSFVAVNSSTASGSYSIAITENGTASSNNSAVLGGKYGNSRSLVGNKVFPAAFGTTSGARQLTFVILGLDTTDATTSFLGSNGTSSSNSTTTNIVLPENSAFYFKGTVVAGVTGGGNTKGWTIEGVVKRGAAVAFVGTPTVTSSFADAGASSWTLAVATNAIINGINIVATGQASTNIRWVGNFEIVEMTY
jgi:hypothetical protein